MFYLLGVDLLLLMGLVAAFMAAKMHLQGEGDASGAVATAGAMLAPAMLVAVPLGVEFIKAYEFEHGGTSVEGGVLALWCTLAGGLLGSTVFAARLWRQRRAEGKFLSIGANVLGFVVSAYMAIVAIDQFIFFRHDSDAGWVNWAVLRHEGEVKDIECQADMLVVRATASQEATYRCPLVIVMGKFGDRPFIPWPSYTEGRSAQLASAVRRMNDRAIKVTPEAVSK